MNERTNERLRHFSSLRYFVRMVEGKGGGGCLLARLLVCRLCFGWCWLVLVGGGCVAIVCRRLADCDRFGDGLDVRSV